jgi:RNA polymerase sigma-70 factor (ECF subfamily)
MTEPSDLVIPDPWASRPGGAAGWPADCGATAGWLSRLLENAAHGNERALDRLLTAVQPLVIRYCRARLGLDRAGAADEVAHEIGLAVRTAVSGQRIAGSQLSGLVYGLAMRKVTETRRTTAGWTAFGVDLHAIPAHRSPTRQRTNGAERAELMHRLIEAIAPRQREVLVLRLLVGLNVEQTAQTLGSTPGDVRIIQHRALNRLRDALSR